MTKRITLERTYQATVADLWALWTTKDGFESWWGPEGFRVEVSSMEVRVGGAVVYQMIAATPEMEAFMKAQNMPPRQEARFRFTEVSRHERLALEHAIDFVPGVAPYGAATTVEFQSTGDSVRMLLSFEPLHDEVWTQRHQMGWESQLGKLAKRFAASSPR